MNAAPSSSDSAPPYNFSDTWQFPINGGGNVALSDRGGSELRRPHFGPRVALNHRGSRGSGGGPPQDEDSPNLHSSSGGSGMNGCCGRTDSVRVRDESRDYKAEMELSSGKGVGESPQPSETPKQDYIHVRARRGQATDSHSLAERARRDKISERMKILQDLVPGCNKVVGKALVLDEIINYIQSLQCQVEFLSMKLETVNSRINSGIEEFPSNDFDQQTYDAAGVSFGPQASRQYGGGSSPEWLHMQVGSFPRTT